MGGIDPSVRHRDPSDIDGSVRDLSDIGGRETHAPSTHLSKALLTLKQQDPEQQDPSDIEFEHAAAGWESERCAHDMSQRVLSLCAAS